MRRLSKLVSLLFGLETQEVDGVRQLTFGSYLELRDGSITGIVEPTDPADMDFVECVRAHYAPKLIEVLDPEKDGSIPILYSTGHSDDDGITDELDLDTVDYEIVIEKGSRVSYFVTSSFTKAEVERLLEAREELGDLGFTLVEAMGDEPFQVRFYTLGEYAADGAVA